MNIWSRIQVGNEHLESNSISCRQALRLRLRYFLSAKKISSMAERHFFHWATPESVLLVRCYSFVSNEEGGPGINQQASFLWGNFCNRYHSLNPPAVTDKHGAPGPPRDKQSMINKWARMGGFLSEFLRCTATALANHRSGDNADQDNERALDLYYKKKGHPFAFMEEYLILSVNPKWMLDTAATNEQAARRAGTA